MIEVFSYHHTIHLNSSLALKDSALNVLVLMFDFCAKTRREIIYPPTTPNSFLILRPRTSRSVHRALKTTTPQVCPSSLPLLSSCL